MAGKINSWITELGPDGKVVTIRIREQMYTLSVPGDIQDDSALHDFVTRRVSEIEAKSQWTETRRLQRLARKKIYQYEQAKVTRKDRPSSIASALFLMLSPKKTADAQLGDLEEMFTSDCKAFGARYARAKFWARILLSVGPLIYRRLERIGFIAFLIDLGRRKLGL